MAGRLQLGMHMLHMPNQVLAGAHCCQLNVAMRKRALQGLLLLRVVLLLGVLLLLVWRGRWWGGLLGLLGRRQ